MRGEFLGPKSSLVVQAQCGYSQPSFGFKDAAVVRSSMEKTGVLQGAGIDADWING